MTIYNENDEVFNTEYITDDKNIISILEIQGIKFTQRNFVNYSLASNQGNYLIISHPQVYFDKNGVNQVFVGCVTVIWKSFRMPMP